MIYANDRLSNDDSEQDDTNSSGYDSSSSRTKKKAIRSGLRVNLKQIIGALVIASLSALLVSDLARFLNAPNDQTSGRLIAWASWIGEVPTAAELYGDAANEMPTTEAFDDEDEDEELDASASNEYPDNENENDESYDDPDESGEQDGEQESRRKERWLPSPDHLLQARQGQHKRQRRSLMPAAKIGGEAIWQDLEGWRRNKRDLEDRVALASHRAAIKRRSSGGGAANNDQDEFSVEDGDEDAWVHDGVDDIHIDPETKRAASELSYDEAKSIDAEYDPHQKQESALVNRTRITTIAEVIPMEVPGGDGFGPEGDDGQHQSDKEQSTRISSQYVEPPHHPNLMPASHLTIDQAQRLVEQQAEAQFYQPSASELRPLTTGQRSKEPKGGATKRRDEHQRPSYKRHADMDF